MPSTTPDFRIAAGSPGAAGIGVGPISDFGSDLASPTIERFASRESAGHIESKLLDFAAREGGSGDCQGASNSGSGAGGALMPPRGGGGAGSSGPMRAG